MTAFESRQLLRSLPLAALVTAVLSAADAGTAISGRVTDPQGKAVAHASVAILGGASSLTDSLGNFTVAPVKAGRHTIIVSGADFETVRRSVSVPNTGIENLDLHFEAIHTKRESIVISAKTIEPVVDLRNAEVFAKTLFTRDDQVFQQLNAGINAGQHEGGGKSLEIRRFGFNLDHGGVNGGLKVLVDNVQQNQGTQGHGQGYLGSLKALSPELIEDVSIINGPFSAEYGDFSGLGVVHIRQRESLPDTLTVRLEGGNFDTGRGFIAWSPSSERLASYIAYEGSYTDGPFQNPGRYRRDNINANLTRTLDDSQKIGFRILFGRNDFYSSGQLPLDLVSSGAPDRFGYIDPTDGGSVKLGTASGYYSKSFHNGDTFKADAFVGRSLFDLFSNFTFYLNDPVNGDAFQQHDSRLQDGFNVQYAHPHRIFGALGSLTSGLNFHDNQINVGLYSRDGRVPTEVTTMAHAHVTNEAAYLQETLGFFRGRLIAGGGVRFDEFRYNVRDEVDPVTKLQYSGKWQGKASLAFTPSSKVPLTFHANYGRGINSIDARGVVQHPELPRLATTDFYQLGVSYNHGRFGLSGDTFLIDHSHEQVYIPDDGSYEFKGPSRAYGFETKASVQLTRYLALNGAVTKVANAFYRGGQERLYVDSAPHFVASSSITATNWHGWSGSIRMRAINHYRLDDTDPAIVASGHTVFDMGLTRRLNHRLDLNFSLDNFTNRSYYETQNYFESRVSPDAEAISRIHGTPGYPLTIITGITFRLGSK